MKYMPQIEMDHGEEEEDPREPKDNKEEHEAKLFMDSIAINKDNPIVRDMECEQKEKLENEFRMDRGHIMVYKQEERVKKKTNRVSNIDKVYLKNSIADKF